MYGLNTINNVTKNAIYRLYFVAVRGDGASVGLFRAGLNVSTQMTVRVSTDSGSNGVATNTPVAVGSGLYYVDLTATEMNGDRVVVTIQFDSGSNGVAHGYSITTGAVGGGGGGLSAADLTSIRSIVLSLSR